LLATSLVKDPGGIVHVGISGPSGILFIIVLDMFY
jgi:hypothetical protein